MKTSVPNQVRPAPTILTFRWLLIVSMIFGVCALNSSAASITLTNSDPGGTTSFDSSGRWNVVAAPAPGNAYFTANFTLRTTNDTVGGNTYIFQGDSLSLDTGGRLLGKVGNGAAGNVVSDTIIVTNLILNGGNIDIAGGNTANATTTVGGNITINAASGLGAIGGAANGSSAFETLNIIAPINGSAPLRVAGSTVNAGADSGVVIFSAANPYSGTIQVSNNIIASTVNRLLQLNNLDAVSNATVNLVGSQASPMSFANSANTGIFNIGGLTGTADQTLNDTAGAPVTVRVGGNNSNTTYRGGLTDYGNLVKSGSGTLLLAGTNTYTGFTTVSNGTLALAAGALLSNSVSIVVNSGAVFDVSSNAFTLAANQSLQGSGTVNGSVTVASGGNVYAGLDLAYGANTITTNLTFLSGALASMDLGTSFNGPNDLIVVGGDLTLNNTTFHLKAPSTSVNLDQTTDYTLVTAAGTITGNAASTPVWDVAPLNAANYSVVQSGNKLVLHFTASTPPAGTGSVDPNPVARNQSAVVTVTVTSSSHPITSVTLDATALGGPNNLSLVAAGGGVYTNSILVGPSVSVGSKSLVATITDSASLVGSTPSFSVTVTAGTLTWNGAGSNNNWSSSPNWAGGRAPGYAGDSLIFAGSTRLAPNMDADYTIASISFDSTAGHFVIGSDRNSLTLSDGGVFNSSANSETLNVPITTAAPGTFSTGGGLLILEQAVTNNGNLVAFNGNNITVNGEVTGTGGLQSDANLLLLTGTNTFTGNIAINSGTLQIGGAGLLGGGNYAGGITNLGVLQYSSSATQTFSGVISGLGLVKDGVGKLILGGANTYFSDTLISNGVLQVTGTLGGGNYFSGITDNGTLEWSGAAAQTLGGVISGSGGLVKDGNGTLTLNGANTYSGPTLVNGGTLVYNPNNFSYPTIPSLSVESNAVVTVNANNNASLPIGDLTLITNSTLNLSYDFGAGNPTVAAVSVLTNLTISGTNRILITGFGAALAQFPLISYVGTPLPNLNNFILSLPPGVTGTLVNNTANDTIDLNITAATPATWIPLNASDAAGTNSFATALHWNDGNPPTSGNGYNTKNFVLRSPNDTNAYTFGGSALSIDAGGRFLMKGGNGQVIMVTNLILNGGLVDYANVNNDNFTETLTGGITLNGGQTSFIGALGLNPTTTETLFVTASIGGTGNLQIGGLSVNGGADIGSVIFLGTNTYSGSTTVATGTLVANGETPNTTVNVVSGGTLSGSGSIGGAVSVQAGGTLEPGITAQGALTNTIGTLTVGGAVSLSGSVIMKINRDATPANDKLTAPAITVNSGATLTVNNIGSATFAAGDTFTLFSTPISGAFTTVTLPPLSDPNLSWANNLAANGSISVVSSGGVNANPTNITTSVSGNTLTLSWPADHLGWHLQVKTNSLTDGPWFTIPGSDAVTTTNFVIDPANASVFFRMVYP